MELTKFKQIAKNRIHWIELEYCSENVKKSFKQSKMQEANRDYIRSSKKCSSCLSMFEREQKINSKSSKIKWKRSSGIAKKLEFIRSFFRFDS